MLETSGPIFMIQKPHEIPLALNVHWLVILPEGHKILSRKYLGDQWADFHDSNATSESFGHKYALAWPSYPWTTSRDPKKGPKFCWGHNFQITATHWAYIMVLNARRLNIF